MSFITVNIDSVFTVREINKDQTAKHIWCHSKCIKSKGKSTKIMNRVDEFWNRKRIRRIKEQNVVWMDVMEIKKAERHERA